MVITKNNCVNKMARKLEVNLETQVGDGSVTAGGRRGGGRLLVVKVSVLSIELLNYDHRRFISHSRNPARSKPP